MKVICKNPIQHNSIRNILSPKECIFCLESSLNLVKNTLCNCNYYYDNNCANKNIKNNIYKCPLCRKDFKNDLEMGLTVFPESIANIKKNEQPSLFIRFNTVLLLIIISSIIVLIFLSIVRVFHPN